MNIVKTIEYKNKEYKVVKFRYDKKTWFGTISSDDIENSKLKRTLNGIEMMMAETIDEAILKRKSELDYRELVENFLKEYDYESLDYNNEEIRNKYFEYINKQ